MTVRRETCPYAAGYCEENVYVLARTRAEQQIDGGEVVLISNSTRSVALACQSSGRSDEGLIVWDYHVIYLEHGLVYDLDSTLPFPVSSGAYAAQTFPVRLQGSLNRLAARFSVLPAGDYLRVFSSDRTHMLDARGRYLRPPPSWPPIRHGRSGNTLFALVDGFHPSVRYHGDRFPETR